MKLFNKKVQIKKVAKIITLSSGFLGIALLTLFLVTKTTFAFTCPVDPDYPPAGTTTHFPSSQDCPSQASYTFSTDAKPNILYTAKSQQGSAETIATLKLVDATTEPLVWNGNASYDNHAITINIWRADFSNSPTGMTATRFDNGQNTKSISIPINDAMTALAQAQGISIQNVTPGAACTTDSNGNVTSMSSTCTPNDPCTNATSASTTCQAIDGINGYLDAAINFLATGVGVVVVIMIVIGGIQYITAGGDPQGVAAAKKRITNALIALLAFILMYAFLQFIIPGGVYP